MKRKRLTAIIATAALVLSLAGCGGGSSSGSSTSSGGSTDSSGASSSSSVDLKDKIESDDPGTCKSSISVAMDVEPPMLDSTLSTSVAARDVSKYIYEGLVEMDANYEPQPQLAESIEHSDDYKNWTFHLRKGVLFHDGSEMTSEDVVASLNRWARINGSVGTVIPEGTEFTATDDYTVTISLPEPCSLFLYYLANPSQFAGITTAEAVAGADSSGGYKDYIGTGSLKFDEWKTNDYIRLVKFNDYSAPDRELSGSCGDKTVDFDEVTFYFVKDSSSRVASALTNEYDIVENISYDNLNKFEGADNVSLVEGRYAIGGLIFIKKPGCGSYAEDKNFRLAVSTALDIDTIVAAQVPAEECVTVNSSYMPSFQSAWYSDAGSDYFNQKDTEKAKEYLAQSSYDGGEVNMVTTQEYPDMYNGTLIIQQELEAIGIKVNVEVLDWATMLTRLNEPETLDMFVSNFGLSPIPNTLLFLSPTRTGFTSNADLENIFRQMNASSSLEEAEDLWQQGQQICWEDAEYVPLGHRTSVNAITSTATRYTPFMGTSLWGIVIPE